LLAVEPIEVDVRKGHSTADVLADEGERRRGDVLGRTDPLRDALDERRLARAQLSGEDDDVARAQQRRERGAGGTRVVGGSCLEYQRVGQNSSS
jgi:hypothetical protein